MPDHLKPSRLLLRLEAEIANAPTQIEADCKRAERAAYLARLGRFEEAKSGAQRLRERYAGAPDARISSWTHLVTGLVAHFTDMDPVARDGVLRANALSAAAGLPHLRALSAAWVAHMDYLQADFESMSRRAAESLQFAALDDHSSRTRVSLVLGQAYHFAGRFDLARPWYDEAHKHATAEGDDAAVSALMHNMGWLRGQQLRIGGWLRAETGLDEGYALLGAESVANFDAMIGARGLESLVTVLSAQIHCARGHYEVALGLYDEYLDTAVREGMSRLRADLLADRAWCLSRLSRKQESRAVAAEAAAAVDPSGHFDDRVMAHARLSQVFAALGDSDAAVTQARLAEEALEGHRVLQRRILVLLDEYIVSV